MLGVVRRYLCAFLLIVIINSRIVAQQVSFTSRYNGRDVIGYLNSTVNFTWTFSGDVRLVDWGTKKSGATDLDEKLVSLNENGQITLNVPPSYSGRVNGSWDGRTPGKLMFTLASIKEEDDSQIFICKLSPKRLVAPADYDTVQLIVRDPPETKIVIPKSSVLTARVGDSASFICNVSGIPIPTVTWMKRNGSGLSEVAADSVKHQVIPSSGSSQLIIKDISVDDQGYYICNASSFEFHVDSAFLGVISLYENYDSCPSTNQSVTRGVSSTICCPVHGFPPPQVTWKYPNGTVSETGNTILPVTPKVEDFGKYTCNVTGLKETIPDPIIVTINVQEEGQKILIRADDITQLKKGDLFKWNEVKGARNYICRICGPDINCTSLLGDKPSLEIPYTTLKFKRPENKPDPVQVMIEVLAVGENDVLGKGGPFNLTISPATTPGLSFTLVIIVFMSTLNL